MQGSKILVLGCGFIGSNIVEELAGLSSPPRVLTRSTPPAAVAKLLRPGDLLLGDAREPELVERALEGIDHVIFSAGGLLPAASEENPELDAELTLGPVQTVLEALRPGHGRVLHYDQYVHPRGHESVSFASVGFYR